MENDNRQAGDELMRAIDVGAELLRLSGADFSYPDYVSSVEAVLSALTKYESRCARLGGQSHGECVEASQSNIQNTTPAHLAAQWKRSQIE